MVEGKGGYHSEWGTTNGGGCYFHLPSAIRCPSFAVISPLPHWAVLRKAQRPGRIFTGFSTNFPLTFCPMCLILVFSNDDILTPELLTKHVKDATITLPDHHLRANDGF